jgi:hypothetical protein
MTRTVALLAAFVTSLTLAATATATQPPTFRFTTTLDAVDSHGGCCSDSMTGETTGVFPHIGRATLSVGFTRCGASYCGPNGENYLFLNFVTPSGATLVVSGYATGGLFTANGTWDIFSGPSTGRFADATGSGTWSASFTATGPGDPLTGLTPGTLAISLAGSLSLGSD